MKKSTELKKEFIEVLKEVRTITRACALTGIGKTTYYEWGKEDLAFYRDTKKAITEARGFMCDLAEDVVMESLREGNVKTAQWVLMQHHGEYGTKNESQKVMPYKKPRIDPHEEVQEQLSEAVDSRMLSDMEVTGFEHYVESEVEIPDTEDTPEEILNPETRETISDSLPPQEILHAIFQQRK